MGPDQSAQTRRSREEGGGEWQDWLEDSNESQETTVLEANELDHRRQLFADSLEVLTDREQHILAERRLKEEPKTLEELSQVYGVSRERIRQIEEAGLQEAAEGHARRAPQAEGRGRVSSARLARKNIDTRKGLPRIGAGPWCVFSAPIS